MDAFSTISMWILWVVELLLVLLLLWLFYVGLTSPIARLYNFRNIFVRWRATLATVLGIALVVAVFVLVQSLAVGLEKSASNTGDPRNVMIVRKGSTAESSSQVSLQQFQMLHYWPEIARDAKGNPIVSADVVTLISQPRIDGRGEANVSVRGLTPMGMELRPQVRLIAGRWFTPGKREVTVSSRMAKRFSGFKIGDQFKTAGNMMTVVGEFDGGNSAFDSEVWMDADEARAIYDRQSYSSVLVRVTGPIAAKEISARLEADKRLPLRADLEVNYYAEQTATAKPIKFLGEFLALAMSIGAVFAAMNTMYASVGSRTREIGTLRVLGFRRRTILASFIIEGALLAAIGGVLGCLLALPLHGYSTGTMSFNTFSETVFQFRITPWLAMKGIIFAVVVGVVGSLLPAIRAARLPVIAALKAV
jgi:putative ABC transport system permease protein